MTSWEDKFVGWTKPPSDSEDTKRKRTESEIRDALAAHPRLRSQTLSVYAKGSYPNNTNVRLDSDIDIAVENTSLFWSDGLDDRVTKTEARWSPYTGPYDTFGEFKTDVHQALTTAFGPSAVKRENKCVTVRERSTTLPADVVPCWSYRYYYRTWLDQPAHHQGIVLWADRNGQQVVNWPKQHHDNGVNKNDATRRRYKRTVRVLKRLENEMVAAGVIDEVPSYLIECLVYACPNHLFGQWAYTATVRDVLATVIAYTASPEPTVEEKRWREVNERKYLFHVTQKWTRDDAFVFAHLARKYLGL